MKPGLAPRRRDRGEQFRFETLLANLSSRFVNVPAGVDAQSGNKRDVFGNVNKWDDAQDTFDDWAAQRHNRQSELSAGRT
ncbi:MAG: hypothetical protein K8T26_08210 [Lentisphaerae bacterium]|nr:hypothetical protein [Lentisphaerota bacterium]